MEADDAEKPKAFHVNMVKVSDEKMLIMLGSGG